MSNDGREERQYTPVDHLWFPAWIAGYAYQPPDGIRDYTIQFGDTIIRHPDGWWTIRTT